MGKHKKSKHSREDHIAFDSLHRKRSYSTSSNEAYNSKKYSSKSKYGESSKECSIDAKYLNKSEKKRIFNSNNDSESYSHTQQRKNYNDYKYGCVNEQRVENTKVEFEPSDKKIKFREMEKDKEENDNSEDEIMFDWKEYSWELNRLFFSDGDLIKKDSEEYKDFWKFLQKYQALSKQKKIKDMCIKKESDPENPEGVSKVFELPLKYDKRYCINFAFKGKDWHNLQDRLPPIDFDDKSYKRLSQKKITEFKFILLLYLDFMQKKRFNKLKKIRESQNNLPIAEYKSAILENVKNNTVTIIAGDTGCGKSTQIPQYLLSAGYINIACTQPRRIACISLCKRVSYETLNEYGSSVGFQIRFEKSKTDHTKIVFLTEGLLLRQVASDPMLNLYNVIILDEIHERHLQTDFLLGVIKCLTVQRPDIKLILMSATINIDLFSNYFMGKAPVLQIPGRLYPIELKYLPISIVEKSSKTEKINPAPYVRVLQLIDNTYPVDERGDLLIFLSGIKEITAILEAAKLYAQKSNRWVILSLHSTLSVSEQEKVFDIPPEGVRKCIVSTNIAETSVTIDGVRFVVDSGKVKEMSFDSVHKMQKLQEFWISQASAEQRKGRAGRTGPGVCFRMYSETEYNSFAPYTTPEILRVPLDSLVLQMIAMGLPNIKLFPFIEPPSADTLESSLQTLKSHSALTPDEELTSVGQLLSQLPLDISLGKMLIMGSLFHKLGPVLSLAAAMSVQSPFTNRAYRDPDCVIRNKNLLSNHGDPFTLLIAYREWLYIKTKGSEDTKRWCRKRGLEEQRFYEMTKLRQQFSQMLRESGLRTITDDKSSNSLERARRFGELYQLKQMKRDLYKQGPRKSQVLRVDHEGGVMEPEEDQKDVGLEIKDLDFKIRYDDSKLRELYEDSKMDSFKDVILLKLILCCGLYPNLAIADEHNNYKSGSEQLFHTPSKPFAVLHPNSIFSSEPETLELNQSEILNSAEFSDRHPCSNKHQLLAFVSLLETNKAYLVNTVRTPSVQTLLLFSRNIYTNVDISTLVCDEFIEMKFADRIGAQNLLFQAVILRSKWKQLLEMRIRASKPSVEDPDKLVSNLTKLEKELSSGLIDLFLNEQYYTCRRLLAADVKLLHYGPGPGDMVLTLNPFTEEDETCLQNHHKGGVILTPFLTYNSLIDLNTNVTSITSYDAICPYCDQELHLCTLERLYHMKKCLYNVSTPQEANEEEEAARANSKNKEFWCDICLKMFWLTIKDILKHKKSHI